jgi:two-component system chemotaxis response regulator CheB
VIAASTGGPTAITRIVSQLEASTEHAVLIAQHMPGSFTGPFADRLNRYSSFEIREAVDGESIRGGTALVCPGHQCMEVVDDANLRVRLRTPALTERYVPSADRLLTAAASAYGRRVVAVILTGMGDDGAKGARQVAQAGGRVLVESEATSVVYGMPRAALSEVPGAHSVPIHDMATWIERMTNLVGPR